MTLQTFRKHKDTNSFSRVDEFKSNIYDGPLRMTRILIMEEN